MLDMLSASVSIIPILWLSPGPTRRDHRASSAPTRACDKQVRLISDPISSCLALGSYKVTCQIHHHAQFCAMQRLSSLYSKYCTQDSIRPDTMATTRSKTTQSLTRKPTLSWTFAHCQPRCSALALTHHSLVTTACSTRTCASDASGTGSTRAVWHGLSSRPPLWPNVCYTGMREQSAAWLLVGSWS